MRTLDLPRGNTASEKAALTDSNELLRELAISPTTISCCREGPAFKMRTPSKIAYLVFSSPTTSPIRNPTSSMLSSSDRPENTSTETSPLHADSLSAILSCASCAKHSRNLSAAVPSLVICLKSGGDRTSSFSLFGRTWEYEQGFCFLAIGWNRTIRGPDFLWLVGSCDVLIFFGGTK
jgi:hypothetical protein